MFLFNTKKIPEKNVEQTFDERISKIESDIRKLNNEVLDCITSLDSIRNKVLRKIQTKVTDTEITEPIQDIYSTLKPGDSVWQKH